MDVRTALESFLSVHHRSLEKTAPGNPTRRRIVGAAIGLFATNGYSGTTMRNVASASGVRAATIYDHFDSKRGLLSQALSEVLSRFHGYLLEPVEQAQSPSTQLRIVVGQHISWQLRHSDIAVAWDVVAASQRVSSSLVPSEYESIAERRRAHWAYLAALMRAAYGEANSMTRAAAARSLCDRVTSWGSAPEEELKQTALAFVEGIGRAKWVT